MVWLTWLFNCRRPQITNQLTNQQEELLQIKWTENRSVEPAAAEPRSRKQKAFSWTDVKHWLKIDKRACVSGMELKDPSSNSIINRATNWHWKSLSAASPALWPAVCLSLYLSVCPAAACSSCQSNKWTSVNGQQHEVKLWPCQEQEQKQRFNCFFFFFFLATNSNSSK